MLSVSGLHFIEHLFCNITGKSNLTYEEAIESEKTARKRLGNIPKALKTGLVWLAHHTQRGRFVDLADDVYVFASARYFKGEVVEAIVKDQWCDCKIIKVMHATLITHNP
jgi:bromodomain adjacent to zinc finger domain protein 1A